MLMCYDGTICDTCTSHAYDDECNPSSRCASLNITSSCRALGNRRAVVWQVLQVHHLCQQQQTQQRYANDTARQTNCGVSVAGSRASEDSHRSRIWVLPSATEAGSSRRWGRRFACAFCSVVASFAGTVYCLMVARVWRWLRRGAATIFHALVVGHSERGTYDGVCLCVICW